MAKLKTRKQYILYDRSVLVTDKIFDFVNDSSCYLHAWKDDPNDGAE
jgi:hypothetical protein